MVLSFALEIPIDLPFGDVVKSRLSCVVRAVDAQFPIFRLVLFGGPIQPVSCKMPFIHRPLLHNHPYPTFFILATGVEASCRSKSGFCCTLHQGFSPNAAPRISVSVVSSSSFVDVPLVFVADEDGFAEGRIVGPFGVFTGHEGDVTPTLHNRMLAQKIHFLMGSIEGQLHIDIVYEQSYGRGETDD